MRKLFVLLILTALGLGSKAQAPQGISHQAIVRNDGGRLVTNAPVGIKVSIIQGTIDGASIYSETQNSTSNTNGLVTFVIGQGTVINGVFANIDWADGPYFIKTEMDPAGGANYSMTGTSQLLSVPYALHSGTAETLSVPITETDPVFSSSAANSISLGDISNWNSAFSWGDHTNAGYVLNSRTLTIKWVAHDLSANRSWNVGTVTSVGLALPAIFNISGSPITGSGTLTASLVSQPANRVFASPAGGSGVPTFRALLADDIPDLDWSKITTGKPTTVGGYGITNAVTTSGNQAIGGTKTFSNAIVASNGLNAGNSRITNMANPLNNQDAVTKSYLELSIDAITEDDPIFMDSPASGITTGDILNWNTAFLWDNHADAGYVSNTRTLTINGVAHDLSANRSWNVGTVTSVGLALPAIFDVTESPVTGSGTITASLVTQPANRVFASPEGGSGVPIFRALLAADIPELDWSKITTGLPTTIDGYGITDAVTTSGDQSIAGTKTFSDPILANNGLDAGSSRITNLANPVNDQDAVTKAYFDSNRIQNGTTAGEMLYWDGNDWIVIPPGSYGQTLIFCNGVPSWGGCLPEVTTTEITNNTGTTATAGGVVVQDGGQPVTQRGVCWSTQQNPTIDVNEGFTNDGSGTGAFTSNIVGLIEQTTYYVRAYAINNQGVAYGNQVEFTTPVWTCGLSSLVDADGNAYNTVVIGTQCWMAENLNVGVQISSGTFPSNNGIVEKFCYNNSPANCIKYGGLYHWNEAMNYTLTAGAQGICPIGWRIPTDADWAILISFVGDSVSCKLRKMGEEYWINNECATDEFNFSAVGGGRINGVSTYIGMYSNAYIWTSTQSTSDRSYQYAFFNTNIDIFRISQPRGDGLSIRCIKAN